MSSNALHEEQRAGTPLYHDEDLELHPLADRTAPLDEEELEKIRCVSGPLQTNWRLHAIDRRYEDFTTVGTLDLSWFVAV